MILTQVMVGLQNGIDAIITEIEEKGFNSLIYIDEITGLKRLGNSIHHVVGVNYTDRISPCVVLLLGSSDIINSLLEANFTNAQIIATNTNGNGCIQDCINNDQNARAMWDNYIPPHLQFLTEEGIETEIDTGIVNPLAGMMTRWMDWA